MKWDWSRLTYSVWTSYISSGKNVWNSCVTFATRALAPGKWVIILLDPSFMLSSVSVTKLFSCYFVLFFFYFVCKTCIYFVCCARNDSSPNLSGQWGVCVRVRVCEDLSLDALRVSQEHKSLYVHRGIWYILLISAKGLIGKPTLLLSCLFVYRHRP